jgi:hypothetical protein
MCMCAYVYVYVYVCVYVYVYVCVKVYLDVDVDVDVYVFVLSALCLSASLLSAPCTLPFTHLAPPTSLFLLHSTCFALPTSAYDAKVKIKIIKEVRAITGLGLKEVSRGLSESRADLMVPWRVSRSYICRCMLLPPTASSDAHLNKLTHSTRTLLHF